MSLPFWLPLRNELRLCCCPLIRASAGKTQTATHASSIDVTIFLHFVRSTSELSSLLPSFGHATQANRFHTPEMCVGGSGRPQDFCKVKLSLLSLRLSRRKSHTLSTLQQKRTHLSSSMIQNHKQPLECRCTTNNYHVSLHCLVQ